MWRALKQLGLFYVFLLFFSVSPNDAEIVHKAVGEDVVLSLPLVESPIQRVQWKHNGDIAAEMDGKEVQCLLQFKARVAKPSVKTSCKAEMTSCLLTCEGNTADAEPIISKWFLDGRDGPLGGLLIITEDTKENRFRCMMMNPVSNETSESVTNPFSKQTKPIYTAIGGDAVLKLPPMDLPIQSIEWKHNEDIAADWRSGDKFQCLGQFEGRCEVNTDTGALTIKKLYLNDSGIYTSEINGKDFSKTQLSVISRVAKPSVKTSCNTEKTSCDLTCEGNTAEAEPITYTWFIDGKHGPSNVVFTITKDSKEYSFRCLMMNPVSSETSESITNPIIIKQELNSLASIFVSVGIFLLVIVSTYLLYKYIRGRRRRARYKTESVTPETSNQSLTEAAVSNTDQETELTSVAVHNPPTCGPPDTNKDSEKSALMSDKKPETNCEPSADEQRADDGGDVD